MLLFSGPTSRIVMILLTLIRCGIRFVIWGRLRLVRMDWCLVGLLRVNRRVRRAVIGRCLDRMDVVLNSVLFRIRRRTLVLELRCRAVGLGWARACRYRLWVRKWLLNVGSIVRLLRLACLMWLVVRSRVTRWVLSRKRRACGCKWRMISRKWLLLWRLLMKLRIVIRLRLRCRFTLGVAYRMICLLLLMRCNCRNVMRPLLLLVGLDAICGRRRFMMLGSGITRVLAVMMGRLLLLTGLRGIYRLSTLCRFD